MRQAAEESQSLHDRLAKAIATAAELEQVVETRQQEMQESQRAMELAYDSHKNSLGSQVDQSVRARERREQTPDEIRELERRIQELIGGSTTSSAENVADQLKQAAQKCYEALKVKLSAEAQAFQARASLAGPKQEDDDMFELKSQRSFMDATSVNKRSVEEETLSPPRRNPEPTNKKAALVPSAVVEDPDHHCQALNQEGKASLALARTKTKHPQKVTRLKGSHSDLWALQAGQTDLLLVDFLNITCWPTRAETQPGGFHPKVNFLAAAGSHVSLIAETHTMDEGEQSMGDTLARHKFTVFSVPAEATTNQDICNHGGTAALVRTYLNTSPLLGSVKRGSVWSQSDSSYFAGFWLHLKSSCILLGSGYCRGGIDTTECLQVFHAIRKHSQDGYFPVVIGCDFNATPQEVKDSGWLQTLRCELVHTHRATCAKRTVDFFLVSTVLLEAVAGIQDR